MLRVVPDVNIIVSAVITPSGYSGRIYTAWKRRRLFFITSPIIIAKMIEVLRRPHIADTFHIDETDIREIRSLLENRTIRTPHALNLQVIKEDPEDDDKKQSIEDLLAQILETQTEEEDCDSCKI